MEKIKTKKNEENQEDIFSLPSPLPKSVKERTNQVINKSYFYHKESSSTLNDSPDSLKYNPNFNSISKNICKIAVLLLFLIILKSNLENIDLLLETV